MGLIGSIGQVAYEIIATDGTGPGVDSSTKKMAAVGAAMTGVGIGAKLMVDDVNASFLEFDGSMTAVKALGAMSEEEFGKMKDAAIDLSTQVPVSATDVSDAMYKMVSVGYDFDIMMATIPEATKLAVGGNQELSESVDTVINVMGAYGTEAYTAADITNILAKSVGVGKWELGDFTTEMQKNVGVAAQLGMSFEDTAAANVLLQNKFTSAEEAGTAFKTMLLRLVDPKVQEDLVQLGVNVKDSEGNFVGMESVLNQLGGALGNMGGETSKAAVDLKSLGVSAFDSSGKFVGMSKVTADLNEIYSRTGALTPELSKKIESLGFKIDEKTGKITLSKKATKEYDEVLGATGGNVDKMATLQKIFGTEGLRAAMALVEEKDKLSGMSAEMNDATFKENAFNTVVESTGAQLEIATNKMDAAKIMMGTAMAPATILAADAMSGLADILLTLPQPLQEIAGVGLFAAQGLAALGPALMGMAALKGLGLGSSLASIGSAIAGMGSGGLAAAAGMGPLLPIIVGLGIGLAAVYAMQQLGILDWFYELGRDCGPMVADAIDNMATVITGLPEIVSTQLGNVVSYFLDLPGNIAGALGSIGETITGAFSGAVSGIGSALSGIPGALMGAFTDITTAFSALGGSVQTAFSTLFSGIGDYIVGLAQGFISAGYNIIMFIVQGMQSAAGAVGSMIGNIFGIIGQYIPHSPAETGPLSVLPNFAGYFVDPLLAITPQVQAASLQVAAAVTMPSAQPAAIGGGGTTSSTSIDNGLSVGTINAKEQSISDIMAELAITQEAQRKQKGYRSLPG
jgi:TP901 family phage tail tape measure protein